LTDPTAAPIIKAHLSGPPDETQSMPKKKSNRQSRQLQVLLSKAQAQRPQNEPTPKTLIFARCALIALFVAWLRLMSGISFTWTIWLGYLLIGLSFVEAWLDPILKKKWVRSLLTVGIAVWAAWFTMAVALARPNLEYHAWSIAGDYEEGAMVGDIHWRPKHFVDLRFSIVNKSGDDYDDVDINLRPDKTPVAISQVGRVPGVTFITTNGKIAEVHAEGIGPDGKPFQQQYKPGLSRAEVVCEKLRAGQPLQIVLAIANFPRGIPDLPDDAYGPKVRPSKMLVEVKLRKGQQHLAIARTIDVNAE
jgi:hypothetical protein